MKKYLRLAIALVAFAFAFGAPSFVRAQVPPKVLVLYDAPPNTEFEKLGFAYAIMLRNLLGHFDAATTLEPVHQYTAGQMNNYDATFYLGAYYDNPLPAAFLSDAAVTSKTLVWSKYNIWQLAWNSAYNFQATRGFGFSGLRGLNAAPSSGNPNPGFFDSVLYKNRTFVKYYAYSNGAVNADPDLGVTAVTDASKAQAMVMVNNPKTGETAPYVMRSGRFWYVADMPFSYIGPRDRYLVIADLLHDMLGINHAESHRALVRLEDVGAMVTVDSMKRLTDYLKSKRIPFGIATIPYYADPLGAYNGGVPQYVPLSQATNLKKALNYALARGGEIVMHGYTHQYSNMRNPWTGVSGDDFEFWNIVANTPVAEDSTAWASQRLQQGLADLHNNGYTPFAWETPHYQASALSSKAVPPLFSTTWQRCVYYTADKPNFNASVSKDFAVGQIYPYPIARDYYGQRILPESLGNIEYDIHQIDPSSFYNYTWQDIVTNANYGLVVRDGYAAWFFHPFWLEPELGVPGFDDFKKAIDGITQLGYSWVAPSTVR